jgi:serine/threonine protein kinase
VPAAAVTLSEVLGGGLRGRALAHFELIEPIGVGGMAAVLRARDKQLDRFVALKILPPEMAADGENVKRFHQEARSAAKLDHENIARVFYCGEDQNLHFIAFEFVEGENLRAILEKRGRLPVAEAVRYILQIATGLEHAAARGVVHRDIKPSNIIITPTGRAKLVDMGLARSLAPHGDKALTQSGVTLGTFDYISPEQALEPRDADARSDIYSLGCTFYHMVTGQAPVPEGTAAKKLHHHQHVAPIDPRQLNPEVTDEVAAILGRMMAKDPKDRYPTPLHLVHHLMQVAQHVGAAADVPEGVLFVDTPLPNAPRKRPLLMAALAVVCLGLVLFVLSLLPSDSGQGQPYSIQKPSDRRVVGPTVSKKGERPADSRPDKGTFYLRGQADVAKLRELLAKNEGLPTHIIVEGGDKALELNDGPLVFRGKGAEEITVESTDELPATIKLTYQPESGEDDLVAGFVVEGGQVTFKNLRFVAASKVSPESLVASVVVRKAGRGLFKKCWFAQVQFPKEPLIPRRKHIVPLASVAADNPGPNPKTRPVLSFEECYFEKGQDAVAVNGPATVMAQNCAFKDHYALFHLRGRFKAPPADIHLKRCSARVDNGPAFRLDEEAQCNLVLEYSIFAAPAAESLPLQARDDVALIRQTDAVDPHVVLSCRRNYIRMPLFLWVIPTREGLPYIIDDPEKFKTEIARTDLDNEASFYVSKSPWVDLPGRKDPGLLFQVEPALAEVRLADARKPLGVQSCAWGPMEELPPLKEAVAEGPALAPNEKLVDPLYDPKAKLPPGVYRNLFEAAAGASPGDVILIKEGKDRLVEFETVTIKDAKEAKDDTKPKHDLTLKPYKGHHPILTLALTREGPDATLFKLFDARLCLENLEILLQPRQVGFKSQTVATIKGNGQCLFKQCVFTMKGMEPAERSEPVSLRVVSVEDPSSAMKMGTKNAADAPKIQFQDCVVRGDGDVVRLPASRPVEMVLSNCLLGLGGSLLQMQGNGKDTAMEPVASLKLTRVSAFHGKPLLVLRGSIKTGKGLVKTQVEPRDCLFVSLAGKPLVYLDGLDTDDSHLPEYLDWVNATHNAYSGYEKLLDQLRPGDFPVSPLRMEETLWRRFAKEDGDSKYIQAKFSLPEVLAQGRLEDFKPQAKELEKFGHNLDSTRLPPLAAPRTPKPAVEQEARSILPKAELRPTSAVQNAQSPE